MPPTFARNYPHFALALTSLRTLTLTVLSPARKKFGEQISGRSHFSKLTSFLRSYSCCLKTIHLPMACGTFPSSRPFLAIVHFDLSIQFLISTLRDSFWVHQARKLIKSHIFQCVGCVHIKAELPAQFMGYLPSARVENLGHAFRDCGCVLLCRSDIVTNGGWTWR